MKLYNVNAGGNAHLTVSQVESSFSSSHRTLLRQTFLKEGIFQVDKTRGAHVTSNDFIASQKKPTDAATPLQ